MVASPVTPTFQAAIGAESSRIDDVVVSARGLVKAFGSLVAVDAVDLDVFSGELLALLGPSGCGKTTTLRLIAGFERPDAGSDRARGRRGCGSGSVRSGRTAPHWSGLPGLRVVPPSRCRPQRGLRLA